MNDNLRNMLQASLISDEDEFRMAFDADRIAEVIAKKHVDVTSNVLNQANDEEE